MIRWGRMLFAFAPAVVACASTPPPTVKIASTEAAVDAAKREGAAEETRAAMHLRWAEDQLDTAKTLVKRDDNENAARVVERAEADARLARELNRQAKTRAHLVTVTRQMQQAGLPNEALGTKKEQMP